MKFLITGVCGMIGFAVAEQLLKEGHEIAGVDSFQDYQNDGRYLYQHLALKELKQYSSFSFIAQDIQSFSIPQVDSIIHLAANPGIKYSVDFPLSSLSNNYNSFLKVIEHCRLFKIPLFFASSSSVYADNNFLSESDTLPFPLNPYALSKKQNEEVAQIYANIYQVRSYALRFFTVYGKFSRPDMFIHKIMRSISHRELLTVYGNGLLERDFTYSQDISSIISLLIEKEFKNPLKENYQILNLGGMQSLPIKDMIKSFEYVFQKKANVLYDKEKPHYDSQKTESNNHKIMSIFPEFSFTKLNKSVYETATWYQLLLKN